MRKIVLASLIMLVVLLGGCTTETSDSKAKAINACVKECESVKNAMDLSDGPCLSNKITDDWVCDVAHEPRQLVDDNPENQCPEFLKTAKHFVEVDTTCKLIRAI